MLGAANSVADREFVFLCVPTPQGEDGSADLSYIEEAARQISSNLISEAIVINKSTVPVGSTRVVEEAMGRDDVFVTTVDGGRLFHNQGNGKFADLTASAGLRDTAFAVRYSPGGTTGDSGGARLPPLKKAARPAHPAAASARQKGSRRRAHQVHAAPGPPWKAVHPVFPA